MSANETAKWRDLALRLGNAINRFRNLDAIGALKKIRESAEYSELCRAWEEFDDTLTDDPRFEYKLDVPAWQLRKLCRFVWRRGILTGPHGEPPADGARCTRPLGHEGECSFIIEARKTGWDPSWLGLSYEAPKERVMPKDLKNMTMVERKAHREFWLAWCDRAQTTLGALLAETIDERPATSDAVYEAVNQLIAIEQALAGVLGR